MANGDREKKRPNAMQAALEKAHAHDHSDRHRALIHIRTHHLLKKKKIRLTNLLLSFMGNLLSPILMHYISGSFSLNLKLLIYLYHYLCLSLSPSQNLLIPVG